MKLDRRKAARSVLWSGIENGGLAAVSLISLIVFTRLLSARDFGMFSVVLALVELIGVLVTMLFHDALIQKRDITDLHFDTAFTATLVLSVACTVACRLLAPVFAAAVDYPEATAILIWTSLYFPFAGFTATIMARQRREFGFRALAQRSLVGRIAGAAVGITAAGLGAGLWSLVVQQLTTALVASTVLWVTCTDRPRLRFGSTEFVELVSFGAFSVGALFLGFSIKRVFTIIAGALLGPTAAGFLNLSFRMVDVLWAIAATAVSQVVMPMLANLQSDRDRLRRAYRKAVAFTCIVLYAGFIGLGVTSSEVVELLFGRHWLPSSPYVTALAFLVLVQAPRLFATPVLTAVARPHAPLAGCLLQLCVMLGIVGCFGLPSIGWAVGVWIACEIVMIPVSIWLVHRMTGLGLRDQYGGAVMPFAAAMVMALVVTAARIWLVQNFGAVARLAVLAPLGAAIFVAALWLLDRALIADASSFALIAVRRKPATAA
ncbi:MAG TPA: lipopolysaccharide biosynthesis protein [Candidatus Sulfotelmatobacter sp.]|nr:lipopolysaccharide biosynthesis protein [Candidatus Sulfotelmatobacter sp.]